MLDLQGNLYFGGHIIIHASEIMYNLIMYNLIILLKFHMQLHLYIMRVLDNRMGDRQAWMHQRFRPSLPHAYKVNPKIAQEKIVIAEIRHVP